MYHLLSSMKPTQEAGAYETALFGLCMELDLALCQGTCFSEGRSSCWKTVRVFFQRVVRDTIHFQHCILTMRFLQKSGLPGPPDLGHGTLNLAVLAIFTVPTGKLRALAGYCRELKGTRHPHPCLGSVLLAFLIPF